MAVETQQGKPRPRNPRPGEGAPTSNAVLAGPSHDPKTGRFVPGNQASRLRALKRTQRLGTLDPSQCAPWARDAVELAHEEALRLVAEVGAECSESLKGFATDAAEAHAMYRALMRIALDPETDAKTKVEALDDARMWMKEHRAALLCLRAEARAGLPERDNGEDWLDDAADGAT